MRRFLVALLMLGVLALDFAPQYIKTRAISLSDGLLLVGTIMLIVLWYFLPRIRR